MELYDVIDDIIPLLNKPKEFRQIEEYLISNSNLPGPRANLTLAYKFAALFDNKHIDKELLDLAIKWANISPNEAPTNDRREYLSFCGVLALGSYYPLAEIDFKKSIMQQMKLSMNDSRWRVKEGAAMGLQLICERDFASVKDYFTLWYPNSNFLEKRGFIATLAHPPILKDKEIASYSLKVCEDVLSSVKNQTAESLKSEEFIVLSKGLQYALSVFVAALPEEGFKLLKKYAEVDSPNMKKIIKANLGKARLMKKYGQEVEEVLSILNR